MDLNLILQKKTSVSAVQCMEVSNEGVKLDFVTISGGNCDTGIGPEQAEMMNDLIKTTKVTKHMENYSHFLQVAIN